MTDHEVTLVKDSMLEFYVKFYGPRGSKCECVYLSRALSVARLVLGEPLPNFSGRIPGPYEGGVWRVHVEIPDGYPYKSPSIGAHHSRGL